jgi:LemA protein
MEKSRVSLWLTALDPRRAFRLVSGLLLAAMLGASLAGCGYNDVIDKDEAVKASWAEVQNQYKRRADLVPNLVNVVKGAGQFEQDTLTKVVEARSKVAGLKVDSSTIDDPEKLKKFEAAQNELGGSLSRLLVVAEQYPQLKATDSYRDLQAQLEGTENRITVARRDYIAAVQTYNTTLRTIPSRWVAAIFYPDAKVKETFTISQEAQEAPKVKF